MIKDKFMLKVAELLDKEDFVGEKAYFVLASLNQMIMNNKDVLNDLETYKWVVSLKIPDPIDYYTIAYIEIYLDNVDYVYEIGIGYEMDLMGYCMCSPQDEFYDIKHDCCGIECDWLRPTLTINKKIHLLFNKWEGLERDFWVAIEEAKQKYRLERTEVDEEEDM